MIKAIVSLCVLIVLVWSMERVGENGTDNYNGNCSGRNFYIRSDVSSRKS